MTIKDPALLRDGNSKVLCALLGVSHATVSGLKREGVLTQLDGPRGHWDLIESVAAYVLYQKEMSRGRSSREAKTAEETRKLRLLNAETEGRLIDVGDASNLFAEYCAAVRAGVTALPGRLAAQIAGMSNSAEIRALIHDEITELLDAAETVLGEVQANPQADADSGSGSADSEAAA